MKKFISVFSILMLLFVLSACGTENEKAEDKAAVAAVKAEEPVANETAVEVTDMTGQTLAFEEAPSSVAALSSGDLDMLLALGIEVAGRPKVQGPPIKELEGIPEIGNPHQPNFEKIAEINPQVLIAAPSFKQHEENMKRQGTEVVYTAANSVADIQQTIELFGQIFDKEKEAKAIQDNITNEIEKNTEQKAEAVKTLLVYGAPGTYLAALPNSLSGNLLELAGGENIASDFPNEEKYPQYASLSVEKIIERNPEMVMLITHGEPEAVKAAFEEEMLKNPAWKNLDAVKAGNVVVLPSHLFGTNPGTKVTEALTVMKESLGQVK
ncbi:MULTISPECIES: ABC transporter substrate-binding protein [unclassified Sporosarcina]|uniref:ABC transporter substrate-binding protein n=1 Tax=unclassified Sporosarcina TaxID=2647733 RepID=UPI00203DE0E8|nr:MULTISPECIES: ABC transporter substrate-binding protein [unclassified Sporosarcina]GKV66108.1 iron-hydroxamate ABC transporter substrate-binding protein [Sporosarcina sp. NCCP-2331]GLB56134.1 iron-hydroxamate ABC transporter substrate-binding protein [Sporosarcina sp. NCCP-2378]